MAKTYQLALNSATELDMLTFEQQDQLQAEQARRHHRDRGYINIEEISEEDVLWFDSCFTENPIGDENDVDLDQFEKKPQRQFSDNEVEQMLFQLEPAEESVERKPRYVVEISYSESAGEDVFSADDVPEEVFSLDNSSEHFVDTDDVSYPKQASKFERGQWKEKREKSCGKAKNSKSRRKACWVAQNYQRPPHRQVSKRVPDQWALFVYESRLARLEEENARQEYEQEYLQWLLTQTQNSSEQEQAASVQDECTPCTAGDCGYCLVNRLPLSTPSSHEEQASMEV